MKDGRGLTLSQPETHCGPAQGAPLALSTVDGAQPGTGVAPTRKLSEV